MIERDLITAEKLNISMDDFRATLSYRLDQKGRGIFVSSHEVLGVINEEMHELTDAIKSNDPEKILDELMDVVIAAFYGYASLSQVYLPNGEDISQCVKCKSFSKGYGCKLEVCKFEEKE